MQVGMAVSPTRSHGGGRGPNSFTRRCRMVLAGESSTDLLVTAAIPLYRVLALQCASSSLPSAGGTRWW
jgi:hypothetical protein